MSWRAGPGRREWVSYGPFGTAVVGLLRLALLVLWAALVALYAIGWVIVWLLSRPFMLWRAHRQTLAASR